MKKGQLSPRKLADVAFFQEGPGLRTHQFTSDGMKVINVSNILPDGSIELSNTDKHISLNEFETRYTHFAVDENDIVLASSGNSYGKVGRIRSDHLPLMMNTSVIRFHSADRSILNDDYLYAFLRSPDFHSQVNAFVIGGAQPNFGPSHLKQMTIPVPPLAVQERIANAVSAYDDLIENNRRRMALLEESARLLYQEWFVHLRFPGHEHVRVNKGRPEGWTRESLREIAKVNRASMGRSFDGKIDYIDIASVTPGQINETTHYDFKEAPSRARRILQHGDIIWSCVRPNRKSHAVIWRPSPYLIASTGFAVITPMSVPTSYLLQATTTTDFVGYLENHAKGAAYPAVVADDFERALILVPSKAILDVFNDFAEPLFEQCYFLRQQNLKLRTARDLLLPRLMSVEVIV